MSKRRQIAVVVVAALGLLAVVLGSLRWEMHGPWIRERLEAALSRDTGFRITSIGSASFTALPWPILQISFLELSNGASAAETASVPLAKARLNLFSWVVGEPRISALTLFEPRLNLKGADRLEETEAVAALVSNYLRQGRRPALTHLRVQSGEVTLDGARWLGGLMLTVSNIASRDLRLTATGSYRAMPFRLNVEVAPAARASARPIAWEFDLGDLSATFRGLLVAPPSLDAEGRISVALGAGALRSRPLALPRETAMLLDGLSIQGEGRLSLPQVQLRSVVFERGGHRVSGGIDAVLSGTSPRFSGTLHARNLDVGPVLALEALSALADGRKDHFIGTRWLKSGHADLRLSVERLSFGNMRIQDVAASAKAGGGRMEVSLSEARVGGGVVKARATLTDSGNGMEARLSTQISQVDLAAAFGVAAMPFASGIASGQASMEMSGASAAEVLSSASGRGQLAVRNGEVAGIDVERFLRRAGPQSDPLPDGRSGFRALDAAWRVSGGVLSLSDAHVSASLWSGRIEGDIDLRKRQLDILARLSLELASGRSGERSLRLDGPVSAPALRSVANQPGRS